MMSTPDREESERALRRRQEAEDRRDQHQAHLDALDARERAAPNPSPEQIAARDDERRYLNEEISRTDKEIEDAEIAYHRALGDHEKADNLEADRLERHLIAQQAAEELVGRDDGAEAEADSDPDDDPKDPAQRAMLGLPPLPADPDGEA